jgi:UDP-N-acetylglucosamine--N-acetylmuramyl-(pentapeptide) pyrophosphoryl-undecaprenol N-acetylglucosamine transferase
VGLKGEKIEGLQGRYEIFDQVCPISAGKFRRYHGQSHLANLIDIRTLVLNIRDLFKVIKGVSDSQTLLKKIKPDVVFSKGSYVAVPVGIAAHLQSIPIVTHDSDYSAGLANRIVGRWAGVHATGVASGDYPYAKNTIKYVGIPLAKNIKPVTKKEQGAFKESLGLPNDSIVVLVAGGGLGAKDVNDKILAIAGDLLKKYPSLYILHLSGSSHESNVTEAYRLNLPQDLLKRVNVLGFTDEFYKYSAAADVVITRAGATALAEFAAQAKACIVIPSPFLTGGHQLKNARMLEELSAVKVIDNAAASKDLEKVVSELIGSEKARSSLAKKMGSTAKTGAAAELAAILIDIAKTHQEGKLGG